MDPFLAGALIALLGALAGAVATYWLEGFIRNRERRELRERAEGRVSINAYALHRQLESWLKDWPAADDPDVVGWIRRRTDGNHLDIAESRVHAIVAESLNASSGTVEAAQKAVVLFYSATGILNEARVKATVNVTEQDEYGGIVRTELVEPWDRLLAKAKWQLRSCRETLEALIHPRLKKMRTLLKGLPPAQG